MATQNRISILLPIYTLLCIFAHNYCTFASLISAHSQAVFACDVEANPALANFTFCDQTKPVKERVKDLVSRLSLKEKIGFMSDASKSVSRLGIPMYMWWNEILHGVSNFGPGTHFTDVVPGATSFPQVILTAASFNATLFKTIAKVMSTEARAMFNLGLAGLTCWSPNINILRDPRWGRSQETPGEDPLLTSIYGKLYVQGLQEREDGDKNRLKLAATCKHHTAYDVDNWKGIDRYHFNAVVTKQDMVDTFEPPFKSCVVDGKAASLMCSYNQVNGIPTCANKELLKGVVRGKYKLNGYICSDCDSLERIFNLQKYTKTPEETAALSLLAGVDLDCGLFYANHTEVAVKVGLVNESHVDMAVTNNLATLMRLGFFDGDPSKQLYGNLGPKNVCASSHQELAREAARQGIVLLKNTNNSLPLCPNAIKSLAVIGPNANATEVMLGNYAGKPCEIVSPLQGLSALVHTIYEPGCLNVSCSTPDLDKTKKAAAEADATVIVVGTDSSIEAEYLDRVDLTLSGQQALLVSTVANASRGPVILVVMSGGGIDVKFAKNNPKISGIIWVGYPGEAGGVALADVIFGFFNPSGRLPMTWYPQWYAEKVNMTNMNMRPNLTNCHPGRTYRFYMGETVYKFGDGLSYTTFKYQIVEAPKRIPIPLTEGDPCRLSMCKSIDLQVDSCKSLSFNVTLKVQNTGYKAGSHSVLLFFIPPSVHDAPIKNLVGFKKLHLAPKESGTVRFIVDVCRHLSVIDEFGKRKLPLGLHLFDVGNLKHPFTVEI